MDRFLPTSQAGLQPSAVLDGNEPQAQYASYDINEEKRFWKGRCIVCMKARHGHWSQCGHQCGHCNVSKGITGPNTHRGQPCPNTVYHPQWWKDIGDANVGETNLDEGGIQNDENIIQLQEDLIVNRQARIQLQTALTKKLKQSLRRERGLRASVEAELQEEKAHNEQLQQRLRREVDLRATAEDDAQHLFDKYNDKKDKLRELARYTRWLEAKVNKMESCRERSRSTPDRRSAGRYESREDHRWHRSQSRHRSRARRHNSRSRHHRSRSRRRSSSRHRSQSSSRPYEALNHNTMESHVFSPGPSDDRLLGWVETQALGAPPHMSPTQPPMHAAEDTRGSVPTGSINYDQSERSSDSPEDGVRLTGHVGFMSTRNNAPGARGG